MIRKRKNKVMRDRNKVTRVPDDIRKYPLTVDECYWLADDDCFSGQGLIAEEKYSLDVAENGTPIFDGQLYRNE